MDNPFDAFNKRLDNLERMIGLLLHNQSTPVVQNTSKRYLNSKEAAEFLNLSVGTVRNNSHIIPHHKRNGKLYFIQDELVQYLESSDDRSEPSILKYKRRKK
ncbi:helix-turn-helix domain-containing protein [Siphonobacter curvatus]|uniref:Helix-turn-helix domain-containing protein n=1 Tax=Siphonobacter curvatus TaxID=2094562 RepID=A0A2S7IR39_9BACT|nr:helix-turn-helix domain-containing protein [Siphonobacter curvatus]PQA60152.1 hypothetical protein C5O19_11195 [Siphonobacter curvatus]